MNVEFTAEQIQQLSEIAAQAGTEPEQLVKDAVARMLDSQARFVAGVKRGIAQADRGEFVEHADVLRRIDRLFQS
jgi:predicted transcriptional regulator